jgi:two-component system, chemotaxis family, sensor kinase Cph1
MMWFRPVRGEAVGWEPAETETAAEFVRAIVTFLLRRAGQRAELSQELERTNRELEAFSYPMSHYLRARFRQIVGYAAERQDALYQSGQHYLQSIIESARPPVGC